MNKKSRGAIKALSQVIIHEFRGQFIGSRWGLRAGMGLMCPNVQTELKWMEDRISGGCHNN